VFAALCTAQQSAVLEGDLAALGLRMRHAAWFVGGTLYKKGIAIYHLWRSPLKPQRRAENCRRRRRRNVEGNIQNELPTQVSPKWRTTAIITGCLMPKGGAGGQAGCRAS
jgi:hypothetical protein